MKIAQKPHLILVFCVALTFSLCVYPVLAAQKPTYIIVFIPLNWSGSRDSFEREAQRQAELFVSASGIEQYARVEVKILDEGLVGVSLRDENNDLIDQVVRFGLAREPGDRYVGLTDGDLAPDGDSWVGGYTYFFSNGVVIEALGESGTAHEFGHTFGLCDEYKFEFWDWQNRYLVGGCPNPWPTQCSVDEFCEGAPGEQGENSIMGPSGLPGPYAYNLPCYEHLQKVFAELFTEVNQPPEDTPTPALPTVTLTPGPTPTPSPTPQPPPQFLFSNPELMRWSSFLSISSVLNETVFQPDWSPDGRWVAFVSPKNGNFDLFVISIEGDQLKPLSDSPGRELYPRWMPDSSHLIYSSDEEGTLKLYSINMKTGFTLPLEGLPEPAGWPAVRKDGKQLVFAAAPFGDWDIFIVDLDAQGLPILSSIKQIIQSKGTDISPDWSPDASRLVFASDREGNLDIFGYDIRSQSITQLSFENENEWAPRWTKNGMILYHIAMDYGMNIILLDPETLERNVVMFSQPWAAWPAPSP